MIFTCDKQSLQDALTLVVRAVSTRTTMSILECVLLTATENGVILCASDLEVTIETKAIPAQVESVGSIALDAKLFTDIVRKLSGQSITIEVDETFTALCKGGRSRLKISGQPPDEFPLIDELEIGIVNERYSLKTLVLKDMIKQTIFSVSLDQSKMVLTGELLEIKENILRMVAVDMFRISYRAEKLDETGGTPEYSAVVPGKSMNELSRILPADEDDIVNFFFTPKWAVFETDGFRLVSRLLEGDFVRYDQIFNEDFITAVTVDRVQLLNAFERAVLVAIESRMPPTQLDIKNDDILITAHNERGQVNDGVPCEMDGKELTIHFNPRYFIEALRVIEDERVVLKFNTPLSPCTLRGEDESIDCKYLIVPLRPPA